MGGIAKGKRTGTDARDGPAAGNEMDQSFVRTSGRTPDVPPFGQTEVWARGESDP